MKTDHRQYNIVLLLPRKLFPLVSGYSLKNYHLIKILSKTYRVKVILIYNGELSLEEKKFYGNYIEAYKQYRISVFERMWGVIEALCKGRPVQTGMYFSRRLAKKLKISFADKADIIIYELIRMMPYSDYFSETKINIFDMAESIGFNYKNSLKKTNSFFLKLYYAFEYKSLLKYEKACIEKCNAAFLFNREEWNYWKKYGNVQYVPHGVKKELFFYNEKFDVSCEFVAFIGKMDYQPNVDAVIWYAENIHAKLHKAPEFIIIGAYPTKKVRSLQKKYRGIKVLGYIEQPYKVLNSALAVVAPMQTGGGIQNKVLEAMALGKAVLLSSKAAAPIYGAEDRREFIVCNTLKEFEKGYAVLRKNEQLVARIERNAREFVKKTYTWEIYGMVYENVLRGQLREKGLPVETVV